MAPVWGNGKGGLVTGSNRFTAERRTPLANECTELHRRVAADTGAWCLTTLIRRHKWLQDRVGKLLFKVLNVERDAKVVGNATRIIRGIEGAAALAMAVTLIRGAVQAHPHSNNFMPRLDQECGSDR